MSNFVHLHLHSQYSVLDGAIKIKDLIKKVQSLDQKCVGMTDHGTMHGIMEFFSVATAAGVKPVLGCEVYLAGKGRFIKESGQRDTYHLTLLAKSNLGYQNLCKLVSLGFMEGFYFKPRIDHEILKIYSKDLVCLSGCVAGELAEYTTKGDYEGAKRIALQYYEIFKDNYYLEIQPHRFQAQILHNQVVKRLSDDLGIPIVATNDCHYLSKEDHHSQEVLMCISMQKLITDPDRIKHDESELYLKSYDEMNLELPDFYEALALTNHIAESCNVDFDLTKYYMPNYDVGEEDLNTVFIRMTKEGLEGRLESDGLSSDTELCDTYRKRLEMELSCILQMGFPGYFLVVSDFIKWSKSQRIPVGPGRGSAAGSLVAYALSITEIDPIKYSLLFERFLNPDRVSLPDIDVDFCIFGREKVLEYVSTKYGTDKVAQIVTFGTLKAKAAIKDVGRVLGFSYAEMDKVAKLVPAPRQGFDYPLREAIEMEKKLKDYAETDGKELIDLALKLEGLSRHTSTHAAGIVISDNPIVEYCPLMLDKEGQVVTQYSMNWVEKIGLVKFDFLGLKTLSVIDKALVLINEHHGLTKEDKYHLDINTIPLDDRKTFKLIAAGKTIGVFQLESSGITEMVSRLKPTCFEDIVAILALYRPGPLDAGMVDHYIDRKHGKEVVKYQHPTLEPILNNTYGIILYQEQIMQIARDMAGYSLAEADMLRRAMGKKKPEEMAKQRQFFLDGAKKNKIPDAVAVEVFDQMETFARYGFNRSHSVAYAMISYQTAFLKAHYPRQFMASLMTFEMTDTDKTLKNLNQCQEMGISVLPPDVNNGGIGFSVVKDKIVYGLAAIKGVGEKLVEKVLEERKNGKFLGILEFITRVEKDGIGKKSLESFIKSGAFDWTGIPRKEMFDNIDSLVKTASRINERKSSSQIGLFDSQEPETPIDSICIPDTARTEWPSNVKLSKEREALGFYLSGHPLERFKSELSRLKSINTSALKQKTESGNVSIAGIVTFLKLKNTKKGDRYATFVLEDLLGTLECVVWPDVYKAIFELLQSEDPVMLSGRLDVGDERVVLMVNSAEALISIRDNSATEALITLKSNSASPKGLEKLRKVLLEYAGECKVRLKVQKEESEVILALPSEVKVAASEELCIELEKLFGEHVLSFK